MHRDRLCVYCGDNPMTRTELLTWCCMQCGLEEFNDMYESVVFRGVCNFSQLQSGYSRQTRFQNFLNTVLGIHFGPGPTSPIWQHLKRTDSIEDLIEQLPRIPCKTKHYECLHSYAKVFLRNYTAPPTLTLREIGTIKSFFKDIQHSYSQLYGAKSVFFSYPWSYGKK